MRLSFAHPLASPNVNYSTHAAAAAAADDDEATTNLRRALFMPQSSFARTALCTFLFLWLCPMVAHIYLSQTAVVGPEAHPLYSAVVAEFGADAGPQ